MCIDELPGCEYSHMLFYGGEFLHLIIFSRKERRKKKKTKKNNKPALQKKHQFILACLLKDSKSQNMKHN